ncbi:MAG: AlpA family phage regulatory protein [Phycisphaerae bacterium]|nr:AlpA family phage regulatory protein [Phycisphaerae bacterium]
MTEQSAQMNGHSNVAQALAVSARQLSQMLGVSLRQCWRLNAVGKLPKPVRLGGSVRWNRQEVTEWFEAGCLDRKTWEARKAVA